MATLVTVLLVVCVVVWGIATMFKVDIAVAGKLS